MILLTLPPKYSQYSKSLPVNFDVLLQSKKKYEYTVDVKFVSKATIQSYNLKFRNIDKPTDVLSFPVFTNIENIPDHDSSIGDLVICEAMLDDKHLSLEESLIHGVLHLLGFDHEENESEWNRARKLI